MAHDAALQHAAGGRRFLWQSCVLWQSSGWGPGCTALAGPGMQGRPQHVGAAEAALARSWCCLRGGMHVCGRILQRASRWDVQSAGTFG